MALVHRQYHTTDETLLNGDWLGGLVKAQLLSSAYTYAATHSTIADTSAFNVGNPIEVTSRTITRDASFNTILDCDDLVWLDQGVLNARYVVFHFGEGVTTDKIISIIDLDDTAQEQEITPSLKIKTTGLISRAFV